MNYDTKKVMLLGSLLFTKEEIEVILMSDDDVGGFDDAHRKGELTGEFEIRKALYNQAKSGDNNALIQWNMLKAKINHNA